MPQVYAIDGIVPVVDPSAFVHPSAVLIGDVFVAARAYIGPCASLRATSGASWSRRAPTSRTTAACTAPLERTRSRAPSPRSATAPSCTAASFAEVGEHAVIAALAFVKAEARIPARSLAAGIPARVLRELTTDEIRWKHDNMLLYQQLAVRSATTMQRVEALTRPEPGRVRIDIPDAIPLSELKAKHG